MATVTVYRHKHLAVSSSVCDVSSMKIDDVSVTDDDDASATATGACVVSPASVLVIASVTNQHRSGRQGVRMQLWKQETPIQLQPALWSVIEIAQKELRLVTWMEL